MLGLEIFTGKHRVRVTKVQHREVRKDVLHGVAKYSSQETELENNHRKEYQCYLLLHDSEL